MEKLLHRLRLHMWLLLLFVVLNGNAQWNDNFSDGNLCIHPEWIGDTTKFKVDASGMLQLSALTTDISAKLATQSKISLKAMWTFKIKLDFNPSSGNYAKIYLMSDTSDFNNPLNGYFVRIGYTSDDVCLLKQSGSSTTILIDGRDKMLNSTTVNARIKVTRDSADNWQLFCDTTGNDQFTDLGKIHDNSIKFSKYFGLQCIFTSTRADKFYFDDFDVTGEIATETKTETTIQPKMYDIVFNEIMADPSPPGSLPDAEFIELYNCSDTNYSTKNWVLQIGNTNYNLPDTVFKAGEFLVLTAKSTASSFLKWCKPIGLLSSTSVLTNTGQYLELRGNNENIITWLDYSDTWYTDDFKSDGGWSIEQIDPANPCGGRKNWKASINKAGGTPGSKNSVYTQNIDIQPPLLKHIYIINDSSLRFQFNEPLGNSALDSAYYCLGANNDNPLHISYYQKDYSSISLHIPKKLDKSTNMNIKISSLISDCAKNNLEHPIDTIFAIPQSSDSLDIIINEVLFNSKPYCPDYIELFNRSSKILSTENLLLSIHDGITEKTYRITSNGFLFYPNTWLLLSIDPEKLADFYTLKNEYSLIPIPGMTSLDDNSGTICIKTIDYKIIDRVVYNEKMHIAALHDTEGISLERINPDFPSHITTNWHSAAETAGFGTPGYQNSQFTPDYEHSGTFTIGHDVFSPDNDGYNDVLPIHYKLKEPGSRISSWVFDLKGRRIKELFNNSLPELTGAFYWDGYSENGTICPIGMYLIFIRVVNDQGNKEEYKLPCVLAIKK